MSTDLFTETCKACGTPPAAVDARYCYRCGEQLRGGVLAVQPASSKARRTDPSTSKAATRELDRYRTPTHRTILLSLAQHGPATCDELCERTGLRWNNCSTRLSELHLSVPPALVGNGARRNPDTKSNQTVHRMTRAGYAHLAAIGGGAYP